MRACPNDGCPGYENVADNKEAKRLCDPCRDEWDESAKAAREEEWLYSDYPY